VTTHIQAVTGAWAPGTAVDSFLPGPPRLLASAQKRQAISKAEEHRGRSVLVCRP
jgi:hypothetical protein